MEISHEIQWSKQSHRKISLMGISDKFSEFSNDSFMRSEFRTEFSTLIRKRILNVQRDFIENI